MTTPNQGIPPTVQTLLGIGAFQIGGGLTNFGQGVNENFVRQLIVGAGNTIWTGVENVAGIIDNIAQWLATLPLEALRMFQYFIPGAVPEQFIDIATAVSTIVSALSIQKLLMSLDDFEAWLTDTYDILLTEVHQILDAIGGLVITPITTRVAGFIDWLTALAGFQTDTLGVLETIGGNIDDLIFGVGGDTIGDVVSAIGHGVQAGIDIAEILADLGIDTIAELVALITQGISALGYITTLIATIPGAVDTTDVGTAINSGVTALTRVLTLISDVGGTTITDVATAITDAGTDAASALSKIADILTAAGVASEAALGSAVSTVITELQDLLDGIANALGEIGSGFTIENIVTNLQNIPIENIVNLPGHLTNIAVTGLYDAAAGFTNTSTSLLKNLTAAGATLGQFNAAALHGAINTATTLGGQALSTIFNGTGQFIGVINATATGALNTALTLGGTPLSTWFTNINSAGQLLLSGATGALNTAVTIGGQAISSLFNGSGHFIGQISSSATGALNTAITVGGTALSTLTTNWNAAVTDVNSLISGVGGTVIDDVNTYLQNIPNTAVQGLTGFGTNIGNTVQALSDGVWQGLRAFLGVPSGVAPPQVANAAQQVRVDLNNATDIATLARTIQAAQAITKQSFLSVDPSADPVFPLSNIAGASPTTVPVVATKTVMGAILLPDVSTKKSITWLGGPLTNIQAVYVNLYTVNKTTGVFTPFHASANIISSLSNPVSGTAWNFYNLPMTDYFDVTVDGTGGNTTTVLGIGDYVVVEIVTVGSGTYNVVGFTNGIPTHTSIYPKGLGASRVPSYATVAYDAVGGGAKSPTSAPTVDAVGAGGTCLSSVGTVSYSHTIASDATCILIGVVQSGTSGTPTVTVGGVAATQVKYSVINTNYYVIVYALMNPPTGTKTVTVTLAGNYLTSNSVSYKGVTGIGLGVSANSSGTAPTQTISATANTMVFQVLGAQGINSFSAYSKTSRWSLAGSANSNPTLVGDFIGSSGSNTGSATLSGSTNWASAMVPLIGGGNPISWSHTATAGAYVVAAVVIGSDWANLPATPSATVTYGGTAMTLLGTQAFNNSGATGIVALYGLANAPGGAKTVVVTGAVSGGTIDVIAGNTVSYTNVSDAGTVSSNYGATTSMSVSATGVTSGRVVNALACNAQASVSGQLTLTSYSGTSRSVNTPQVSSQEVALLIGDSGTVGSISFTATETGGTYDWGGLAVVLWPTPTAPAAISSPTYDTATPWIALAGAAGRSQHAAETVEFETAGSGQTYTVPSWVIDGDYIDIVPIGAGAGGSYLGDLTTTVDASYKGGGPGQWSPIRLRYGDAYDIPTGTTTFTVNVGAGGSGASNTHPTHSPAHGSAGDNTTVVITGYPTITANGGSPNGTTIDDGPYDLAGDTAGNVVHEGVTYFGGAVAPGPAVSYPGPTGNSPGGGGGGSISVHSTYVNGDPNAGAGAPGACYITAVQA